MLSLSKEKREDREKGRSVVFFNQLSYSRGCLSGLDAPKTSQPITGQDWVDVAGGSPNVNPSAVY